jgi:hypothetical protein
MRSFFEPVDKRENRSEMATIVDAHPRREYVHMNMKTYFRRLWARLRHKFAPESQQLELSLWTRRTRR